ncbi:MAG TPA: dihydrofolate reductase family protein [Cellulomonas sp.]
MSRVRVHNLSISLDGFAAGEDPSTEAPLGRGGERLHEWVLATRFGHRLLGEAGGSEGVDDAFAWRTEDGIGAAIMGRGTFGPQAGPWTDLGTDDEWRGWWGERPPFGTPVYVLTHHPRPPLVMDGGTVFHFVDARPPEVLALATDAAGGLDVRLGGGATTVREFLAADLVDLLHVVRVPVVLGRGARLWDDLAGLEERFEIEQVASPSGVVHLTFTRRT